MDMGIFKKGLSEARKMEIPLLNFFGGEPLLNPDIFEMIQIAINHGFYILLNTNGKLIDDAKVFQKLCAVALDYKDNMIIQISTDQFHLLQFDPHRIIQKLENVGFSVKENDYNNDMVFLTEYNKGKNINVVQKNMSCCGGVLIGIPGLLPNGSWSLCPPSLLEFSNIDEISLSALFEFRKTLLYMGKSGCTECLQTFPDLHEQFEKWMSRKQ